MQMGPASDLMNLWIDKDASVPGTKIYGIFASSEKLPLKYWKPNLLFRGLSDESLKTLTHQRFPGFVKPGKSHPIFSLKILPNFIAAELCPCSTKRSNKKNRYISEGCILNYTNYPIHKNSYLLENIKFKIPAYSAGKLTFLGEVPESCLKKQLQ